MTFVCVLFARRFRFQSYLLVCVCVSCVDAVIALTHTPSAASLRESVSERAVLFCFSGGKKKFSL